MLFLSFFDFWNKLLFWRKDGGVWLIRDIPLQISRFWIYHKSSCFESLLRTILHLHDSSFFRVWIYCCWREGKYILAGKIAWIVGDRWPKAFVNSKMDTWWLWYRIWHFSLIFWTFSCGNEIVIVFGSISIPKNSIICVGITTDFSRFIINSNSCNKRIIVSLKFRISFTDLPIISMSSR